MSFPNLEILVWLADEKDFALVLVGGLGIEHQDRLLLFDAGQVKEIGIGDQRQRGIGVARQDIIRINDRQ